MLLTVTETDINQFEKVGAICLRGFLDRDWINCLNRGVDWNLENPSRLFKDYTKPSATGRCFKDRLSWERIPEYQQFLKYSPLGAAAGELLRCDEVFLLEDQYIQKEAGNQTPSPWHQDLPFFEVAGSWIGMWVALDPCDADNALSIVTGSHLDTTIYRLKGYSYANSSSDPSPELPDMGGEPPEWRILGWDVEPGDVIAFHPRLVHGNSGNNSCHRARRFVARFVAGDAYYDKGKYPCAQLIDGHGLSHGDLLRGPKFPLIWTRRDGFKFEC